MTDQDSNKASEDKAAEVAPYMSTKKEDEKETTNTSLVIPVILSLALAVVVIASFFEDEVESLIASLSTGDDIATANEETIVASMAETSPEGAVTPKTTKNETAATPAVSEKVAINAASAQAKTQSELITVYNPYLRPYPQVYAPIPPGSSPNNGYSAMPYGLTPQQAQAYTAMMQKRQEALTSMQNQRLAALQRREQQRMEMFMQIDQQRVQAQKAHAERMKRMQAARTM